MRHERIPVAYRAPFDFNGKVWVQERPPGESILEIVRAVPVLPLNFLEDGYVCINGQIVPRERWAFVRPKPPSAELPIAVTLHLALQNPGGGGSSGTKSVVALVAALALVVITAGLASPVAAAAFPLLGTSLIGVAGIATVGQVVAGVVGIAGALAIGALTAPPTTQDQTAPDTNTDNKEPAGAQGNVLDKGGAIPRVLGTRKVYPPLAGEPVVELSHQDEYVEAVFVLNGPHALDDIRLEGTDIFAAEDVEVETREGWDDDTDLTLVQRQGRMQTPNLELSGYQIASSDFQRLDDQSTPTNSLPVFHNFTSRSSPDEIWFHFACPGGLSNGSVGLQLPLRISFRRRGDSTWINLPELHIGATSTRQLRCEIRFKWISTSFPVSGTTAPSTNNGWVYAYTAPTPQSATPATPTAWVCDSWFDSGNGSDTKYWYAGSPGTTRVQNISFGENNCEVYLDEGTFPKGIYEFQIKRGTSLVQSSFTKSGYQYLGQIRDFFWYVDGGTHNCPVSQAGFSDHTVVTRVQSIWNSRHLSTPGKFALIAVKALNRTLRQLSTVASGYVQDNFDGDAWDDWTTTSNPAPHYRDVLTGSLNLDPLPTDQIDDDTLQLWRYLADGNDWTIDAIISDMRTQDVLSLIASCGYARPYQSDQYAVTIDNDRWGYSPVQVFSRRNAASMRFEKAFPRVPAGLIITYRDEGLDDDQAQTVVNQSDPANSDLSSLESISYDGLLTEAKARTRGQFDLDQANLRSTFYYVDADIESIVARRGDLVAMQHDMMTDRAGDGYITSIQRNGGGDIIGVTLDSQILIHADGQTGIAIRHTDGTISTHLLSNTPDTLDNVLTFVDAYPDPGTIEAFEDNFPENLDRRYGSMAVAGHIEETYRRYLVQNVQPGRDLTAQLTLVDEANALQRSNTFIDFYDDDPGFKAFIVPDGCHQLFMEVWGGGGGGSGGDSSNAPGGSGGGYARRTINVTPGEIIFYYVGNGGSGGADGVGDDGQDSWVNVNDDSYPVDIDQRGLIAHGGHSADSGHPAGGSHDFADVGHNGGEGGDGDGGATSGGGGGGGASEDNDGENGNDGDGGGAGGNSPFGDGGDGNDDVGEDGAQAGGGGGGSWFTSGGRGGDGLAHFSQDI